VYVSRCPSGRTELRSVPGQRVRGGEPPHREVLQVRSYAGPDVGGRGTRVEGIPVHAGSADALIAMNRSTTGQIVVQTPIPQAEGPAVEGRAGTAAGPRGFASGYAALPAVPDEMLERDGSLRPHWQPFVSMLDELGSDELLLRWDHARRLIHEN